MSLVQLSLIFLFINLSLPEQEGSLHLSTEEVESVNIVDVTDIRTPSIKKIA